MGCGSHSDRTLRPIDIAALTANEQAEQSDADGAEMAFRFFP